MKDHLKKLWAHVPPAIQHIAKSAFADAGIGMLTAVFAETIKQVDVQAPPVPGRPNPPGSSFHGYQGNGQSWTGKEQYWRRHTHPQWKGR